MLNLTLFFSFSFSFNNRLSQRTTPIPIPNTIIVTVTVVAPTKRKSLPARVKQRTKYYVPVSRFSSLPILTHILSPITTFIFENKLIMSLYSACTMFTHPYRLTLSISTSRYFHIPTSQSRYLPALDFVGHIVVTGIRMVHLRRRFYRGDECESKLPIQTNRYNAEMAI
jgi:hypothetical protein